MAQTKWHHRYAEVNGVKLHYVEQGKGELILFLHGFPEFWYEWKDLIPEFAKDRHAVAPDMRGYNLSEAPAPVESYRVPVIVEDIHALAVKLKARKFVLVGHDWGGVIAWAFAVAHPEMLDKLVIVNAPHPTVFARELANNPAQQKASAYFNLFNSPQAETFLGQSQLEPRPDRRPELLSRGAFALAGGWRARHARQRAADHETDRDAHAGDLGREGYGLADG
jgi:pimeloyl-ACP methyl ester carboxylesterase